MKHGIVIAVCLAAFAVCGIKWLEFVRVQQNPRINAILKEKSATSNVIVEQAY